MCTTKIFNAYKQTNTYNLQYVGNNSDAPGGERNTRHRQLCGVVYTFSLLCDKYFTFWTFPQSLSMNVTFKIWIILVLFQNVNRHRVLTSEILCSKWGSEQA